MAILPVPRVVDRIIELAHATRDDSMRDVALNITSREVRDLSGAKRASARREILIGEELNKRGVGRRNSDGTFTVYSDHGPPVFSLTEALEAEQRIFDYLHNDE